MKFQKKIKSSKLILMPMLCLFVFGVGCGGPSGGGKGGGNSKNSFVPKDGGGGGGGENPQRAIGISCVNAQHTACVDFIGRAWTQDMMQKACGQVGGQLMNTNCESQNQIAFCVINRGNEKETVIHYFSPVSRDQAQQDCAEGGGEIN